MTKRRESFFWVSYSDLMTSLFFIMLVLFVIIVMSLRLRVVDLKGKNERIELLEEQVRLLQKVSAEQKEAIDRFEKSTKELENTGLYKYDARHKKFVLQVKCPFKRDKSELSGREKMGVEDDLQKAGEAIRDFLKRHRSESQYLLIIEGQASSDDEYNVFYLTEHNYELSFKRALWLMKFWKKECCIDFGDNCEIQIAGSGDGQYNYGYTGYDDELRLERQNALMRSNVEEENQRFLVHIIPKNIMR